MSLCFKRDYALNRFYTEVIGCGLILWGKLLDDRTFGKSYIIFISRKNFSRILLRCFLNHRKQTALHYLTIYHKFSTKNLMATVFTIDLCKAKNLRVG